MTGPDDRHDLSRFVQAQENGYRMALAELVAGRKRTHWIWFVFPQLDGLATSAMSRRYAIRSLEEAGGYLDHPVLGPRLLECAEAVIRIEERSATEILGSPDDHKLRSCATLFSLVAAPGSVFERLLEKYYGGERDVRTLTLLGLAPGAGTDRVPD